MAATATHADDRDSEVPFTSLIPVDASPQLSAALAERGITIATPIQKAALDLVYKGHSLSLHSETGSGKTLAMLLPALLRLADSNEIANDDGPVVDGSSTSRSTLEGMATKQNRRILILAPLGNVRKSPDSAPSPFHA